MRYNERRHRKLVIESVIKDARMGKDGYSCDEDEEKTMYDLIDSKSLLEKPEFQDAEDSPLSKTDIKKAVKILKEVLTKLKNGEYSRKVEFGLKCSLAELCMVFPHNRTTLPLHNLCRKVARVCKTKGAEHCAPELEELLLEIRKSGILSRKRKPIKDARKGHDVYDEDALEQDGPDMSNSRHLDLQDDIDKFAFSSEGSAARRAARDVFDWLDRMEGWLKEEGYVFYDAHLAIYDLEGILYNLQFTDKEQEVISKCMDDLCDAYYSQDFNECLRAIRKAKNTFSSLPTFSRGKVLNSIVAANDARNTIIYNQDYRKEHGDITDSNMEDLNHKKKRNMEARKNAGLKVSEPRYKRRLPDDSDFYAGDE